MKESFDELVSFFVLFQVQEERELLAREKAEKLAEKERKEKEKEQKRMKKEQNTRYIYIYCTYTVTQLLGRGKAQKGLLLN
jgi:predicted GNAT family acetyltransferase